MTPKYCHLTSYYQSPMLMVAQTDTSYNISFNIYTWYFRPMLEFVYITHPWSCDILHVVCWCMVSDFRNTQHAMIVVGYFYNILNSLTVIVSQLVITYCRETYYAGRWSRCGNNFTFLFKRLAYKTVNLIIWHVSFTYIILHELPLHIYILMPYFMCTSLYRSLHRSD